MNKHNKSPELGKPGANPNSQGFKHLPSSFFPFRVCGFDPCGFKMAALPPGIEPTFQAGRKTKDKEQRKIKDESSFLGALSLGASRKGCFAQRLLLTFHCTELRADPCWDSVSKLEDGY